MTTARMTLTVPALADLEEVHALHTTPADLTSLAAATDPVQSEG